MSRLTKRCPICDAGFWSDKFRDLHIKKKHAQQKGTEE